MRAGQPHLLMGALLSLVGTLGCAGARSGHGRTLAIDPALHTDLQIVAQARIFFEHHSVGDNILAGVAQLAAAAHVPLRIVELTDAPVPEGPVLLHAYGGRNTAPRSKLDAFARALRQRPDINPDVALVKLCYVDFTPYTRVVDLFGYYAHTLAGLHHLLPDVMLVPVTVPLRVRPNGPKAFLQRLLGRPVWEDDANLRRSEFNILIRAYAPAGDLVDIARAEATRADGTTIQFAAHGEHGEAMDPRLSSDGGHLNATGQRVVAAAFVHSLAQVLRRRTVSLSTPNRETLRTDAVAPPPEHPPL